MDTDHDCVDIQHLLVGDAPCTYGAICGILRTCKSAGALWPKLVDISRSLEIPEDKVVLINPWLLSGTKTHSAVLYEIIEAWRGKEAQNAKLNQFLTVLEGLELKECADALRQQFTSTTTLGSEGKDIRNKLVLFQGKPMKLGNFQNLEEMDESILFKLTCEEIPTLVNRENTQQLEYYIPRTIRSRNRLTSEVFQTQNKDVFVMQGIERQQLTDLANGCQTDVSGNQIRRLTVRFILLEYKPDFEKICSLSKKPVHWIKVQNDSYFWVKSSGSMTTLNKYPHQIQHSYTETELASNENKVIILSDSPGMGKTILLLKLMEEIQLISPTICMRFIVLKEFVHAMENKEITLETISSWIADQFSEFKFGRKLIKNSILSGYCILLLDGFDEVLIHQIDKGKQILQLLASLESTRIFVTKRPHMREELEDALHVLGYTNEPFSQSDQLKFLLKFWESKGIKTNESVEKFAKSGLKTSKMTDFERQITGIPLQCRMLAETYVDEVERCSRLGFQIYEGQHSASLVDSVFQMYKTHMEMRLKLMEDAIVTDSPTTHVPLKSRLQSLFVKKKSHLEKIKYAHMYYALELLFPEDVNCFKHLLSPNSPISLNEICRCGIVEITNLNQVRFVHRTFAEFFIAMFLVDEDASKTLKKFKIRRVLSTRPMGVETLVVPFLVKTDERFFPFSHKSECEFLISRKWFQFNFPVVCYFLNEFRKTEGHPAPFRDLYSMFHRNVYDKIFPVVFASVYNNYAYVLLEVYKLFCEKRPAYKARPHEIGDLLLMTAMFSDVELMEMFCKALNVNYIKFPRGNPEMEAEFTITPLHVAIQRGHYNLVEYLVTEYKNLKSVLYLFHFCVANSFRDNKVTLDCKKQIIKLLLTTSKQWLNESVDEMTPITQSNVSLELLDCLIQEGADVNVFDCRKQTVLHKISSTQISPESYHWFTFKLFKHGFKHLNWRDAFKKTPLHYSLENVELLGDTVRLLHTNGADFNAVDRAKESVLFYAIRGKRSVQLIQQLIEHGADFLHKDKFKNGVLHACSRWGHFEALQYFIEVHYVDVNAANEELETPLHIAVKYSSENNDKFQHLLISSGTDVNAKNMTSQTPILTAFHYEGISLEILRLMEQHGLIVDEYLFSDLLKAAICNKKRHWNNNFASIFVHLIDQGGKLSHEIEPEPWEFATIQEIMPDVVETTNITSELLNLAKLNNLLTVDELRDIEQAEDALKSESFFSFVKSEKSDSFEIVLKMLISTKQHIPFRELRRGLHAYYKPIKAGSRYMSTSYLTSDSDTDSCTLSSATSFSEDL